ncbi:unnamed protein product [Larinioides sclopetarius]|uniref:G-protein coupled receptors family 1 profile domain-containing protein n=1 Tax=Larinioides sclopetarius TaxID=280406 RepID=A0AAV2AGP1_9ARAC
MSPLEAVSTAVILAIIILATIIGNVLVIISVFTYRPLQNVQNMFIVSLAVADITVAVLVMPLNVAYTLMSQWKFGLPVCKMWLTCDVLCCTASILHLSAIALDRYWAIHDPINYASKRTLKRVLIMIASVWVVSMIISAPPLIGWNDWPEDFTEETPCMLTEERGYVIYSASGSFYIPLVIMTVVYVKIFEAAKDRLRHKAKAAAKLAAMRKSPDTTSTIPLKSMQSEISTIAVTDKERRAARVLGIVMGVFVVCWLPFFLMYVILPFCENCYVSNRVINIITWLGYFNSALNPVIYTAFNTDFRKAFIYILCRKP